MFQVCESSSDLWICLICGHVGCGRYHSKHAVDHWKETTHCYALELQTQRVRGPHTPARHPPCRNSNIYYSYPAYRGLDMHTITLAIKHEIAAIQSTKVSVEHRKMIHGVSVERYSHWVNPTLLCSPHQNFKLPAYRSTYRIEDFKLGA